MIVYVQGVETQTNGMEEDLMFQKAADNVAMTIHRIQIKLVLVT